MTHSRKPNTEQTISEKWITPGGAKVELTVTVSAYDTSFKTEASLILNGKAMSCHSTPLQERNGQKVCMFFMGEKLAGVPVSHNLYNDVEQMIANANTEIAPRVAELDAIAEANYRAERS